MLPHEAHKTESLLDGLHIVEVTREIAEKAGSYKRAIKRQQIDLMDCLIAATAHATSAVLATGNAKHYPMPDIEILTVPAR
jgi:predicted nucleic acid-binding protein